MKKLFLKKDGSISYFRVYTFVFIMMALGVCYWFLKSGYSFIWEVDGWQQHFTALVYYSRYLRSILRGIIEQHRLIIPAWDFSLGEGGDIVQVLHYYVIGDPFTVLSVLVPLRYMYLYFEFIVILRLYFAGLVFSWLCFETGQKNRYGVLAGSMTYVFCYWSLLNIARHPYFLNPLIYFPLILIGIEKILHKKRPVVFIAGVFLTAISNFYFFYIIVCLTIVYVLVRLSVIYVKQKDIKLIGKMFGKIAGWAIAGCLLAAVILMPMVLIFLDDTRMAARNAFHFLYPLAYYSQLPSRLISNGGSYWICMGYAAPVLPALFLLFYKKKNRQLKIYFGICIVIMLFPFLGQILNGFSYMANRWSFAMALVAAYIMSQMWQELMTLSRNEGRFLGLGCGVYFVLCLLLDYSRTKEVFASLVIALFFVLFLLLTMDMGKETLACRYKNQISVMILLVSILLSGFWLYSYEGDNYLSELIEADNVQGDLFANEATAVNIVAESEGNGEKFVRYSGKDLHRNVALRTNLSSTQYFWSMSNSNVIQFRRELQVADNPVYQYDDYDDRAFLMAHSSILYYVAPAAEPYEPYGFSYVSTINVRSNEIEEILEKLKEELGVEELTKEQIAVVNKNKTDAYLVYRNDYALPLAYAYENSIDRETYESLSAVEKQEALLQAVLLEDIDKKDASEVNLSSVEIPYKIKYNGNGISLSENKDAFVVTSANSSITLKFDGLADSETYVSISGLDFKDVPLYDLYFGGTDVDPLNLYNKVTWDLQSASKKSGIRNEKRYWIPTNSVDMNFIASNGCTKKIKYGTADYSYYTGIHDYTVNMNYSEEALSEITITFPSRGIYRFEDIRITCQPMKNFVSQVNKLKENVLENIVVETNSVSGTIDLPSEKTLLFSIPYSAGWKAEVDGEKAELYRANTMYMALKLDAGSHEIRLSYRSPWLREGIMVSCVTALILLILLIVKQKKSHHSMKKNE